MGDFYIKAMLLCGAIIEIRQPGEARMLELTVTPKEGTKIEDAAWIKNGTLRINMPISTLLGFRELITFMFSKPKQLRRKKFLGLF